MPDLFDYLRWRGDLTWKQAAINEIDALIFSRLSFAPFGAISAQMADGPISIQEAAKALEKIPDIARRFRYPEDKALLEAAAESPRFRDLILTHYAEQTEPQAETQFSAVTIHLDGGLRYLTFRGTDDTLVGWKENFNMSFLCPVPAQERAVGYVNTVAAAGEGPLMLGGHSKGGNLAIYAASFCAPEVQERIRLVYNFDGPGFDVRVLEQEGYQRILGRIASFVPQSSIVGLLLGRGEQYTVVKSTQFGPNQHNVYSWEVERDRLVYLERVTDGSRLIDRTLKGWLADLDAARREQFIDALYAILSRTHARTLQELDEKWLPCAVTILSSLNDMDEETRKLILEALSLLAKNAKESIGQAMSAWGKAEIQAKI